MHAIYIFKTISDNTLKILSWNPAFFLIFHIFFYVRLMKTYLYLLPLLLNPAISQERAKPVKVPGVIVDYTPASSGTYIGSPSVCILPDGSYVASHDFFGPSTTEHVQAMTAVFRSDDKGKSWEKISEIRGQFWSNLFFHRGSLYIMGTYRHHGNFIIRRSTDNGISWSEPANAESGLLLEGEYHTAPMPVIIHGERIWRALENASAGTKAWGKRYSAMMISAPETADLLKAGNWTATNWLPYDSTYLDGQFGGWLEGNAVVTPAGEVADILRVGTTENGRDLAAIVNISDDGRMASFDPSAGSLKLSQGR